jgi:hypothetical protein
MLKQLKSEKPAIFSPFTIPAVEDPLSYAKENFNPIERLTNYYMLNWSADTVVLAGLSFEFNPYYWYSKQPKYFLKTKVDMEAVKDCLRFDFRKKYESTWADWRDTRIYLKGDLYYKQLSKRPDRFRFSKDPKAKSTTRIKIKEMILDDEESFWYYLQSRDGESF